MKQESVKKKLSFRKAFIAHLDKNAAQLIVGGANQTKSNIPCACPPAEPDPSVYSSWTINPNLPCPGCICDGAG